MLRPHRFQKCPSSDAQAFSYRFHLFKIMRFLLKMAIIFRVSISHAKTIKNGSAFSKVYIFTHPLILVPRAAILLASATDRELWQGPKTGSPRITDFRLSAHPKKFETITVIIGYKNGQLLRLRTILAPARALDPWRWPKGSQLWGRECHPLTITYSE